MQSKVTFKNVTKEYYLYKSQTEKLLELLHLKPKNSKKNFEALKNVSFEVFEGETVGIVGINGAGKSTLSNLLAQIIPPTKGEVNINGEPSLVSISAGLNNHLSGLENIRLKCLMLGLSEEKIKKITPKIIEFADIGNFIKQPIKTYSSGMKSRLGFAISVFMNPDILIVDEALSVGDQTFYKKCIDKFNEFKKEGKTIFFISHSLSQIRSMSDKAIWLHFGELKEFGEAKEVLDNYESFITWFNDLDNEDQKNHKTKIQMQKKNKKQMEIQSRSITRKRSVEKKPFPWTTAFLTIASILSALSMYIF